MYKECNLFDAPISNWGAIPGPDLASKLNMLFRAHS